MHPSISSAANRVKLRHLMCFLEVARLGSMIKAASALGVTQPAVSKTLHELEETLGVSLFDRRKRNITLNRFGNVFLEYANTSVSAVKQGVFSIGQARASGETAVVIGALPLVSCRILPKAVRQFTSQSTNSKVRVVTGPHTFLMSQLHQGEVHFVLGRMAEPDMMKGLQFEHLYSEELALVVRRDHPLLKNREFSLNSVIKYPILMPPHGAAIRPIADRFFISHGLDEIRDQVESVSVSFGRRYTSASDSIWIISESAIAEDMASGELAALPADMSQTLGPIGLTRRVTDKLPPSAERFAECLRQTSQKIQKAPQSVTRSADVSSKPDAHCEKFENVTSFR